MEGHLVTEVIVNAFHDINLALLFPKGVNTGTTAEEKGSGLTLGQLGPTVQNAGQTPQPKGAC